MSRILAQLFAIPTALLALAGQGHAETVDYFLDPATTIVAFEADFGPDRITGAIPLLKAALKLDFDAVANSHIDVTLDTDGATASFPFAAQALKGPKVLDTAEYPQMAFTSTAIRRAGDGAEVEGDITIRGVTLPMTFVAKLTRPQGSAPTDFGQLTLHLTGTVHRSDFGATGWSDMVSDEVRIQITAPITAQP